MYILYRIYTNMHLVSLGFPDGSVGEEFVCHEGDVG